MLIETPGDRRNIFIDGGKWGIADMQKYVEHFVDKTESFYAVINTHADSDHVAGARRIFKEYEVEQFWSTGYESDDLPGVWDHLKSDVQLEQCDVFMPLNEWVSVGDWEVLDDGGTTTGDDHQDDDVWVQYLNLEDKPPTIDPISGRHLSEAEQRNNASLVIKLVYGDVSFLITGVVIPAGHAYNHPHPSTIRRLNAAGVPDKRILRTDDGDSTPEGTHKDPRGDDSFIFETDGKKINKIVRVTVH